MFFQNGVDLYYEVHGQAEGFNNAVLDFLA